MKAMQTSRAWLAATCIAVHATATLADPAPKQGYVPTEAVAIAVAEAVLTPINGADAVVKQRPFKAELRNGAWFVYGSGPAPYQTGKTVHVTMGGQMMVQIDKYTGAVVESGWLK